MRTSHRRDRQARGGGAMRRALLVLTVAALSAGCGREERAATATREESAPRGSESLEITGAGATFPYPLYSKWFDTWHQLHPDVRINYQSIGSGGGIRQLIERTVFFGATDSPMTDEQLNQAPRPILHFPTTLGAVVPVYNLPGASADLRFAPDVLADLFLGRITRWNDPRIAAANPGVTLPATAVVIVHRSDGSGTTFILSDYLSKVSPAFRSTVGTGTSLRWPGGIGGKGNEGVAGLVKQTPGSLGYVELVYALQNRIAYGSVRNADGNFVRASVESVTAAAAGAAATMPADFRVSITNASGANAYPISSFTWLLLYDSPPDARRGRAMVSFLRWALGDGQKECAPLGYAPLPETVIQAELAALERVQAERASK
jgi:phosphate transport system substrate-binding protein